LNFGSGSFACDAGFTGTISYNCNAMNTPNLSGSCTAAGLFTPNWYDNVVAHTGTYITEATSNRVALWGPNGAWSGAYGHYLAALPSWVTKVSFNWNYSANDYGDYDRGYFYANDGWQYLANNDNRPIWGTVTNYVINPGGNRLFGPLVWSKDGCCGAGYLILYDIVFQ
jgi:hypothetical protein